MTLTGAEKRELARANRRHTVLVALLAGHPLPTFREKVRLNWRKEISSVWLDSRRAFYRRMIPQHTIPARLTWLHYKATVYALSELEPIHTLPNADKRKPRSGWHLDHVMSVWQGWKLGLPAETVAHISNLRIIPAEVNKAKGRSVVYTNLFNEEPVITCARSMRTHPGTHPQ